MTESILERLLARVKVNANGCFEWQAARLACGYGRFYVREQKKEMQVHRVAYEAVRGPIPEGKLVCHHCDNRRCCNPAHLFLGTHKDNSRDCVSKNRHVHGSKAHNAKLTEADIVAICERYNAGRNHYELADEFGVCRPVITEILQGKLWPHVPRPQLNLRPKNTIQREDAEEIRRLCRAGVRQVDIAEMFGIKQVTVSAIKTGRLWRQA